MLTEVTNSASLSSWLDHVEQVAGDTTLMNFDLDRLKPLANRLGITHFNCPVITVGGTNGKGSVVHTLAHVYQANGFRVAYSISPHIRRIHERASYNGHLISDEAFVAALQYVDLQRASMPLTYFEFITLAFLYHFKRQSPDVLILEVGLGGRCDVMNLVENDCAVITGIAMDHMAILGNTREAIAREKAGIFKYSKLAICGEPTPPQPIFDRAALMHNPLSLIHQDYVFTTENSSWHWRMGNRSLVLTRLPAIHPSNLATVLAVLAQMHDRLPVDWKGLPSCLLNVRIRGRFERLQTSEGIELVLDVAHNVQSIQYCVEQIRRLSDKKHTSIVFGMLKQKDIEGVCRLLAACPWPIHVVSLPSPSSADPAVLLRLLQAHGCQDVHQHATMHEAWQVLRDRAGPSTRVVVCGSFYAVSAMLDECFA